MDTATVSYNETSNTFAFDYQVNMHLGVSITENLRADIYTADCETHVGAAEGIIFETINSDGEHVFQFDYTILRKDINSHVFTITGQNEARADFCLRFGMWTGPPSDTTAQLVNWIDTLLIIYFSMDGELKLSLLTKKTVDMGRHRTFEEEKHVAYGYLCDPVTREVRVHNRVTQGVVIHVCIYLDEKAIGQGFVVDRVQTFHWYRHYAGYIMGQVGFENGVNYDGLTVSFCGFNVTECHFSSMISAPFFYTSGEVLGEGEIWMKFRPASSSSARRRLRFRVLQDDSSLWGNANGFNMTLDVTPNDGIALQPLTGAGDVPLPSSMIFTVTTILIAFVIFM